MAFDRLGGMMKLYALAVLLAFGTAHAGPYYDNSISTITQKATLKVSGQIRVAPDATQPNNVLVVIDGSSGTVTAVNFIGNGAGLTGIGSGSGGVQNNGSTTIGADEDDDGVGVIDLQIASTTKMRLNNDGTVTVFEDLTAIGNLSASSMSALFNMTAASMTAGNMSATQLKGNNATLGSMTVGSATISGALAVGNLSLTTITATNAILGNAVITTATFVNPVTFGELNITTLNVVGPARFNTIVSTSAQISAWLQASSANITGLISASSMSATRMSASTATFTRLDSDDVKVTTLSVAGGRASSQCQNASVCVKNSLSTAYPMSLIGLSGLDPLLSFGREDQGGFSVISGSEFQISMIPQFGGPGGLDVSIDGSELLLNTGLNNFKVGREARFDSNAIPSIDGLSNLGIDGLRWLNVNAYNMDTSTISASSATIANLTSSNGANILNLNASNLNSGTVPNARLNGSSVTLRGNVFNGANQLVLLSTSGALPNVGAGSLSGLYNIARATSAASFSTTSMSYVTLTGSTATINNVVAGNFVRVAYNVGFSNGTNNQVSSIGVSVNNAATETACEITAPAAGHITSCAGAILVQAVAGGTVSARLDVKVNGGTFNLNTNTGFRVNLEEIK